MDSSSLLAQNLQSFQPPPPPPPPVTAAATATTTEDRYSLYRFRFWRILCVVFLAAFVYFTLRELKLELGFTGINHVRIVAAIFTIVLSTTTLVAFYCTVRIFCFIHRSGKCQVWIWRGVVMMIYQIILVPSFKENLILLALPTMGFIAYLRAVVGGDESMMIWSLAFTNAISAMDSLSFNTSHTLYFVAVMLLGNIALYIDRGFKPIDAGALDLFLGMLGDLESFKPKKEVEFDSSERPQNLDRGGLKANAAVREEKDENSR